VTTPKTLDIEAAHVLALACRRLGRAAAGGDALRTETKRRDVVDAMATVAEEFGMPDIALLLRGRLPEFDGRCLEEVDARF
jgi:hypothetical protein